MFLRPLKTDQKRLFLALAQKAAEANNVIEESERRLLAAYADEMGIDSTEVSDFSLETICNELVELSSPKELRQIAFEIMGMLLSDMEFDVEEHAFFQNDLSRA